MSKFITKEDYGASIHAEILDAVTRSDATIIDLCEERAISEMKRPLSKRYDVEEIFSAEGKERNQTVLMMAIDIALYHIFSIHNPRNISQVRVDRYKRAMIWLKEVRDGNEDVNGLPELEPMDREKTSRYLLRSNPKRSNYI